MAYTIDLRHRVEPFGRIRLIGAELSQPQSPFVLVTFSFGEDATLVGIRFDRAKDSFIDAFPIPVSPQDQQKMSTSLSKVLAQR